MNPVLRTLEEWTTHQDYVWFLAALAWSAVIAAEMRRKETRGDAPSSGWLIGLATSYIAGAAIELVLLAQDLRVPYTKLDAAMGVAQASSAAALAWAATAGLPRRAWWRAAAIAGLAGLAAARVFLPIEAGWALALTQAFTVLALIRRGQRTLSNASVFLLTALPIVATHGPWAYAMGEGRRMIDWSHFALLASSASLIAGLLFAVQAWRARLNETLPAEGISPALNRDLRRAMAGLGIWLAGGLLLAVWYGRLAQRGFEEHMLRRIETGVLALDPRDLADAFGPELRIESIARRHYPNGQPVDVARLPRTHLPVYATLRTQLGRIHAANPDLRSLYIAFWRDGHMLLFTSTPRKETDVRYVVHHSTTPADVERLTVGTSFFEGPVITTAWLAQFSAYAPLRHPDSGELLGWLVGTADGTRWLETFTQARLQTMALVGAGVGLWALAIAYRLRREARDAAERKAAAADAADRMKSGFLAKVSHELRTPIQSVLGYGELLAGAPLSDQHRAWLAALRSHGDIMLRLVNDLIDLGALQSGAFRLEPAPVALRTIVDDCAAALRPAATAKRLAFHVDVSPAVPAWVHVDGVRLRQVLLNLLTNAVKFTPSGSISLAVRHGADEQIEFVISDTGSGIPAGLHSRLFQPFARLDPAASGGSGLGLALVQGLCTVMGGTVRLADAAGAGATFIVQLPLRRCEAPAGAPNASPPVASFAGLRVLVAEDNTLVRELLVAFLVENGAEVRTAADGNAALALARQHKPDALLLDIALPGLDGIAVAEQLRRDGAGPLRIIGLSAHAGSREEAQARAAGMDVFLAKPVRLAQLASALMDPRPNQANDATVARRFSDDALRSRLESQFARETPRVLSELRAALAAADWPGVRSRAHYLKNSADVIGAVALQDACQRLASIGTSHEPAAARELLDALEAALPPRCLVSTETAAEKN